MTTAVAPMTQGKCPACRIRYVWQGAPLLRDALCPVHGLPLKRTTARHYYETKHVAPLSAVGVQA